MNSARSLIRQTAIALLALVLCLMLSGCARLEEDLERFILATQAFEGEPARPSPALVIIPCEQCCDFILSAGEEAYYDALTLYAKSRVVEMDLPDRDPVLFSAWTAKEDRNAVEADPDGLLTIWQDDYFVTHTWSYYGNRILTMIPGDTVEINDRRIKVWSVFDYPKASYYDEIRALVGYETVVIQTCEPDSDLNRIICGTWIDS